MKTEEQKERRSNPYTAFLVGMLIVMFLNWLVFPRITQPQIVDTDYGTFINMLESGKVKEVMVEDNRIYFAAQSGEDENVTYQTGAINDPELVSRLLEADSPNESGKIIFTKNIRRPVSSSLTR